MDLFYQSKIFRSVRSTEGKEKKKEKKEIIRLDEKKMSRMLRFDRDKNARKSGRDDFNLKKNSNRLSRETTNLLLTRIGFPTEQPFGAAW